MPTNKQVVILGAGAVARYIGYILSYNSDVEVIGYTDRDQSLAGTEVRGKPVLGTDDILADCYAHGARHVIIGVGAPQTRTKLRELVIAAGFELINAVHPSAIVSPDVKLGNGVVVAAGAILSPNLVVDDNTWLGPAVNVNHDTHIGRDCQIAGGSIVGGNVVVGERVLVGLGSVIGLGLRIGDDAIVGSGANVVRDVSAGAVVVGNPARVVRYRDKKRGQS